MRAHRTVRHATLLLLVVAALAACNDGPSDLAGTSYVATEVTGHDLAEGSRIVLAFTEDSVGAQPGCNSMSAPATWDDGTLRLTGAMRQTKMACPEALMAQDTWFAELLAAEPALELDGATLTLTGADTTVVFVEDGGQA